jgi:hypothetical protein
MSESALTQFEHARKEQLDRNEARRMRTFVNQARGDTHGAGARWPFELTQNAHDPGGREGKSTVDIKLTFDGHRVTYEHNGKPFTMQELAALLSGGSSKEFESVETTGRFGTGFLVTHVLSPDISFVGILATDDGLEQVSIHLERGGDENQIFSNTVHCYDAIKSAPKLAGLDHRQTATFQYLTDNPEAASVGLAAFRHALPYLFATCERLGSVHLQDERGASWDFEPEPESRKDMDGQILRVRRFELIEAGTPHRTFAAIRLRDSQGSLSSLVVVVERCGESWELRVPPEGFPRIFSRFPVTASDFLPINAVIDGRFDLRQERDRVLMKDADKEQITEALQLLPSLVRLSLNEQWGGRHKLALVNMPDRAFGESLDDQPVLSKWWREALTDAAQAIASMPVVQTPAGLMSASGSGPVATLVVPRFDLESLKDEIDFNAFWSVASEISDVHPPLLEVASDWSSIARAWANLGIPLRRMGLVEIAKTVRPDNRKLADLKVTTEPLLWLARFLDLVGQVAQQHNCVPILNEMLPSQNKTLKSPGQLHRDMNISETLKNIGAGIGHDVRDRLLLREVEASSLNKPHLAELLRAHVSQALDEPTVIKECIEELSKQLPDNRLIPIEKRKYRDASVHILSFLWQSRGISAAQQAQQCPLIASDNTAIRWTLQRKTLAPVLVWHSSAQPYKELYEADRILAEDYVDSESNHELVKGLVQWEMTFADPLSEDTPRELRDERLRAIAAEGEDTSGVTVADIPLSQIALLPNQLVQRCQVDEELAKLLLGMTLQHIAVNDPSWLDTRKVPARQNRADITIDLYPSLWIADLKTKAWVPVRSEKDGKQVVQPVVADAGNLRRLLDPSWLVGNDPAVTLLTRFFGFKPLELRLLSTVQSDEQRVSVENELAKIVQALGGNPNEYVRLVDELAIKQQRDKQREKNRRFGLAVQRAIEGYLVNRNLHPEFVDLGYDYDLFLEEPSIDAGTHHFKLADYFLEVKATTTGEVRLTPMQAQTASGSINRFILCVVDLRDVTSERLEEEWTPEDVEHRARILLQVGLRTRESHGFVEQAKACEVGIRNDAALRYGVPVALWENGSDLPTWVNGLPVAIGSTP